MNFEKEGQASYVSVPKGITCGEEVLGLRVIGKPR